VDEVVRDFAEMLGLLKRTLVEEISATCLFEAMQAGQGVVGMSVQ
jgi:hypothetical protein